MKTLGIYTNCQGRFLHQIFLSKIPYFNEYNMVYLENYSIIRNKSVLDKHTIQSFDMFIYQPVSEIHGEYSTLNENGILGMLKPECIRISFPSLYLDIWPIFEENKFHYGADNIIQYKNNGVPLEYIIQIYKNNTLSFNLSERFEASINFMISREAFCTIKTLSSYIKENFKTKIVFHTQNHPSSGFLHVLAKEICKSLGIEMGSIDYDPDYLMKYGNYKNSRYMKSELGLEFIADNCEYYEEYITYAYNYPLLTKKREYSLQ